MKQGTLSFASAKRINSIPNGKSQKKTSVMDTGKKKRVETPVEASHSDEQVSEVLEISSDLDSSGVEIIVPTKRTRASTKRGLASGTAKQAAHQPSQPKKQKAGIEREHLDVEDKAGRYRKYYKQVRSKMGYLTPSKHTRTHDQYRGNGAFILFFIYSSFGGSEQDTPNASFL